MATAVRTAATPGVSAEASAVLSEEAEFVGRMEGKDLHVLGRFEGELTLSGRLRVGRQARVKAKIQAGSVELNGEFDGEIRAQVLAFGNQARARGVFLADRLSMQEGARVDGAFNLPSER
jgi:cytoskeletal protein CcmA (bactofilin family)